VPEPLARATHRLCALDAARALASFLVVALHAAVAFMSHPPRHLLWPHHEPAPHGAFDVLFFLARPLGTPLFTVIAGYFAARAIARVGGWAFLKKRALRLALPLLITGPILLYTMLAIWRLGWLRAGIIDSFTGTLPLSMQLEVRGPAHLWYIEYLLLIAMGHVAIDAIVPRQAGTWVAMLAAPLLKWIVIGGALAACIAWNNVILLDFDNGFAPRGPLLCFHIAFYTLGVAMYWRGAHAESEGQIAAEGAIFTASAIALLVAIAQWIATGLSPGWLPVAGAAYALSGVGLLLSITRNFTGNTPPWLARLADAGFMTYLLHVPVQGLILVALMHAPIPIPAKFLVVLAGSVAVPLVLHRWIRSTRAGILFGSSA